MSAATQPPLRTDSALAYSSSHAYPLRPAHTQYGHDGLFAYFDSIIASLAIPKGSHLAIALSGGCDSMALTLLLQQWAKQHACQITALTIDHGLRSESAADAAQVQAMMHRYGIAHHIITPPLDASIKNLQERARVARYDALAKWCILHGAYALCIAHTFDDQAETVMLQSHRGASSPSHSAMAFISDWQEIMRIRPLLGVRKATLVAWLKAQGACWIEDSSNQQNRFARNRLRSHVSDEQIIDSWYHAKTEGAKRHEEDILRADWCKTHCLKSPLGYVRIDLAAWRTLDISLQSDILSRAIAHVSGARQRVRLQESIRLTQRMQKMPHGKATLGGTLIAWDTHFAHLCRETARLPDAIPLSCLRQNISLKSWRWDGRFRVVNPECLAEKSSSTHDKQTLAPLGQHGYKILRTALHPLLMHNLTIPKTVYYALPAMWHLDTPQLLTHIENKSDSNLLNMFHLQFSPPKPLADAPFWWFNHAPYLPAESLS